MRGVALVVEVFMVVSNVMTGKDCLKQCKIFHVSFSLWIISTFES